MSTPRLCTAALLLLCLGSAWAAGPGLGRVPSAEELAELDLSIAPDGRGLPPGSGDVAQGLALYQARCEACHGAGGQGKPADRLSGGLGSLASDKPVKTVNSYWPYATTLFDYIRRAMPLNAPRSLTDSEVYSLCAYLLALDGILAADARLDAASLAAVRMPNRDGFIDRSQER